MPGYPRRPARAAQLTGRSSELSVLDRLIGAVRAGQSRVLVLSGEPGVGKTALLDYLAARASGCRVERAAGVESEMELAFAGLHLLRVPMLGRLDRLPGPQQEALQTAFGLAAGPPPDRFLVGLAVLSLLSEVADERPLVCVAADEQWLDRASAQALGFAARRLAADPVGLVFAARVPDEDLAGLPELAVGGLRAADARALLDSVLAGPLDARVRDRFVAETRGNPLALLELPRGVTSAELAGGFGRRLLQLAAADPSGESSLMWRAAGKLGIPLHAATPAVEAGLVEFGAQVRFRHPLVRSAAYQSASRPERQEVHGALAQLGPDDEPPRPHAPVADRETTIRSENSNSLAKRAVVSAAPPTTRSGPGHRSARSRGGQQ